MIPELKLYNTLSRKKEVFKPLDPAHIRLYACGPTVYNYAHIGNARMAVVFDSLAKLLRGLYPKVTYVSNITDVDDKIIKAAQETGTPIDAITERYSRIYNEDMAALGVEPPDIQPRATEHISDMIALIEKLIKAGHAYEAQGHVLFSVPSFPAYGGLSGRSRDEQIAGARVEISPYKKDPADFVLWKPSGNDQPGWDSPWGDSNGRGRPGWHIECSAMAEKHLGLPFDIHGGGADLKFPHHENEIAQSCCAHSNENDLSAFAQLWVHNGFVTVKGEKMSKSLGNITLVHDLIKQFPGEALRLTLLSAHYRQPLDWSVAGIAQSKSMLDRLYRMLKDMEDIPAYEGKIDNPEVFDALCDDLNTPKAIEVLNAIARKAVKSRQPEFKKGLLIAGKMLGILQHDPDEWLGYGTGGEDAAIDALLAAREQARAEKNFARSDEIRDELAAKGIEIEDTPTGPKWKRL